MEIGDDDVEILVYTYIYYMVTSLPYIYVFVDEPIIHPQSGTA